jgi:hypothetical protein
LISLLKYIAFADNFVELYRKAVTNEEVKTSHVPYYKSLTVETMLDFSTQYEAVLLYLPHEREIYRLPRQFIIDILSTVVGSPFQKWVDEKVQTRHNT